MLRHRDPAHHRAALVRVHRQEVLDQVVVAPGGEVKALGGDRQVRRARSVDHKPLGRLASHQFRAGIVEEKNPFVRPDGRQVAKGGRLARPRAADDLDRPAGHAFQERNRLFQRHGVAGVRVEDTRGDRRSLRLDHFGPRSR